MMEEKAVRETDGPLKRVVDRMPPWLKPNHLSVGRIVIVPLIGVLYWYGKNAWAVFALAVAVVSDILDGAMANIRQQKTKLGEVLDPCADKVLILTVLIEDGLRNDWSHVPAWLIVLVVVLETVLILGRPFKKRLGVSAGSNKWGQAKMWFQSAAAFGLVADSGWTIVAANLFLGTALILAVLSLVGHIRDVLARGK